MNACIYLSSSTSNVAFSLLIISYSHSNLGYAVGSNVPKLFISKEDGWGPALYEFNVGVEIMLAFTFLLGYGATVAEPALDILGSEVEM